MLLCRRFSAEVLLELAETSPDALSFLLECDLINRWLLHRTSILLSRISHFAVQRIPRFSWIFRSEFYLLLLHTFFRKDSKNRRNNVNWKAEENIWFHLEMRPLLLHSQAVSTSQEYHERECKNNLHNKKLFEFTSIPLKKQRITETTSKMWHIRLKYSAVILNTPETYQLEWTAEKKFPTTKNKRWHIEAFFIISTNLIKNIIRNFCKTAKKSFLVQSLMRKHFWHLRFKAKAGEIAENF